LSSHILSEVEKLADTVTIIKEGATVESGTLAELRHLTRTQVSVVLKKDIEGLKGLAGIHEMRREGDRITFSLDNEAMGPVMARLASLEPVGLTVNPPSLEDLFLSHYKTEDGTVSPK
jgi:ABC-2 type transport system ATP-binding protein